MTLMRQLLENAEDTRFFPDVNRIVAALTCYKLFGAAAPEFRAQIPFMRL